MAGSIQLKNKLFVRPYPANLNPCLTFYHGKPFGLPGMKMIAPGNSGFGGRKRELPSAVTFKKLCKTPPVICILFIKERE
jgi:hypothetical protein